MAELRPKIVKLCHIVGGLTGVVNKIDENAPEYYSLAIIVTDEEVDESFNKIVAAVEKKFDAELRK